VASCGSARVEVGGRWHPSLIDFVKKYIKAAHAGDTKMFVYQLKVTTQRIAVALQRCSAEAVNELNRRAKDYPSVALEGAVDEVVGV